MNLSSFGWGNVNLNIDNEKLISYDHHLFGAMTACTTTKKLIRNSQNPNVVIIYTDDVGYGDIGVNWGLSFSADPI